MIEYYCEGGSYGGLQRLDVGARAPALALGMPGPKLNPYDTIPSVATLGVHIEMQR